MLTRGGWLRFNGRMVLIRGGFAGVLVDRGSPPRFVVSKEPLQHAHDLLNRESFFGVLAPTTFEELLDLDGEADIFSVLGELRPLSFAYPVRGLRATLFFEGELSSEDLECQHRESENVCRFRLDCRPTSDDFRSEPHRISSRRINCRKVDVGVNGGKPVIGQPNMAISVNEDICLWA